jgi:hypothetical protein
LTLWYAKLNAADNNVTLNLPISKDLGDYYVAHIVLLNLTTSTIGDLAAVMADANA